jgi:glycosyltransferase involved in cell wall biosynthesis
MALKVAYLVGQLGLGGAEQQLYNLLTHLDRNQVNPLVINFGAGQNEYWVSHLRQLNIQVWNLPKLFGRFYRLFAVCQIIRREKVVLIHSWGFHLIPYGWIAKKISGARVHIASLRFDPEIVKNNRLFRLISLLPLDGIIANSESAFRKAHSSMFRSPIFFVPNGVFVPQPTSEEVRRQLRQEFGFQTEDLLIGAIGRIDSNKNHSMLLRASVKLAHTWPQMKILIIGDGPLKTDLLALAKHLGIQDKLFLLGMLPQASKFFPALDIVCMTSKREGMPNVVMEAQSAGVPVISTYCGGAQELIEYGVTGFLVEKDDLNGMSDFIEQLLKDKNQRLKMGVAGHHKMLKEYNIEVMTEKIINIYQSSERIRAC